GHGDRVGGPDRGHPPDLVPALGRTGRVGLTGDKWGEIRYGTVLSALATSCTRPSRTSTTRSAPARWLRSWVTRTVAVPRCRVRPVIRSMIAAPRSRSSALV